MDRLIFVFSHDIRPSSSPRHGMNVRFSTAFAQSTVDWTLNLRRSGLPTHRPRNLRLELMTVTTRAGIPPTLCSCLFRLQRGGVEDVECNVVGEADGGEHISFAVSGDHQMINSVLAAQVEKDGPPDVLTMVLQLPKKCFLANQWDCPVEATPVELDYRFEPLHNCCEHDFIIVCADGEFSINKGALFRSSNYYKKQLRGSWGDKSRITEGFTLATAKIVFTYLLTHTFLAPEQLTPQLLEEVKKTAEKLALPQKALLMHNMEVLACRQLSEAECPLEDLIRWLVVACHNGLGRVEDAVAVTIVKKFHQQLLQEYRVDVEQKDEKKRLLHVQLHARNSRGGTATPFKKLFTLHQMSERVLVVERAA